ncbi:MAG: arginine N-succinyltransferase [Proteobacteria bacterium]|nr:arginine N-succinyltransferase [Pseudomonadota bacterium]
MENDSPKKQSGLSGVKVTGLVILAMLVTMTATIFIIYNWLFPSLYKPVVLSKAEERQLERKLERFERFSERRMRHGGERRQREMVTAEDLTPEPYSEKGASREIRLSEREINGMIAQNTDLASRLVIDLADDLVSAKLLIPLDPDFPIMGGRILKVKAGTELAFRNGRPVVILRGVSVMGVPLPNAWLGDLKNIDLIREFGTDPGFWKSFADGVETIEIREGSLRVVLKE